MDPGHPEEAQKMLVQELKEETKTEYRAGVRRAGLEADQVHHRSLARS